MSLAIIEYFAGFEGWAVLIAVLTALPYFALKITRGLIAKKSWREIIAAGSKPITGRIWLDALIFTGLLIVIWAIFLLVMMR
jgi:hypothetical protein